MVDRDHVVRAGQTAWAVIGIVVLAAGVYFALSSVAVLTVPLLLALFPAAALTPAVAWLHARKVPRWLAAAVAEIGALAVIGGLIAVAVPLFVAELPSLIDSLTRSFSQLRSLVKGLPVIPSDTSLQAMGQQLLQRFTQGDGLGSALGITRNIAVATASIVLLLVALFFFLYQGEWLAGGVLRLVPSARRDAATAIATRIWHTIGAYFRSLFIIAVVDAVLIGIGLAVLGVPVAVPLALLVFFGGFFPYVGALVSGMVAVLVAFADGGLGIALAAAAIVVGVQALEGNVLEPLIAGRMVRLPAFVVIIAITLGGALLGVFGAFIAVPAAAAIARAGEFVAERNQRNQEA